MNEVEILQKLDHPNIMKVFELYEDEVNYYIISGFQLFFIFYKYILRNLIFN